MTDEPDRDEPARPMRAADELQELDEIELAAEVIDGPLVLARSRQPVVRATPQAAALVQTAAVAATGFVAGVATAAVLGRRRQRRLAEPAAHGQGGTLRAVSHRTYLVDVHLLERQ